MVYVAKNPEDERRRAFSLMEEPTDDDIASLSPEEKKLFYPSNVIPFPGCRKKYPESCDDD